MKVSEVQVSCMYCLQTQGGGHNLDISGTDLRRSTERQWAQAGYLPSNPLVHI